MASSPLRLLADSGDTVWYANGVVGKDVSPPEHKKSRSDVFELGAVVDQAAPVVTITSGPVDGTTDTSASFAFSATDDLSAPAAITFRCQLDNVDLGPCTSPKAIATIAPGAHTFQVVAKDEAGRESNPASYSWTIAKRATVITADPALLQVVGLLNINLNLSSVLTAHLRTSTGQPLAGKSVVFTAGGKTCTAVTSSQGDATCNLAGSALVGLGFDVRFAGDSAWLPSSSHAPAIQIASLKLF